MVANTGQKDYRRNATDIARFFKEFKAVAAFNSEIEQTYVMGAPAYRLEPGRPRFRPLNLVRLILNRGRHPASQELVGFLVFDQQDVNRTPTHIARPSTQSANLLGNPPLNCGKEHAHIQDWFGDVVVETGSEILLPVTNHRMRSECNYR